MIKYLWKGSYGLFALALVTILSTAFILVYVPIVIGSTIEVLVGGYEADLFSLLLRFGLVIVATVFSNYAYHFVHQRHRMRVFKTLEVDLANKLTSKQRSASDVLNIFNKEAGEVVDYYLMVHLVLLYAISIFSISFVFGAMISWQLIVFAVVVSTLSYFINRKFTTKLANLSMKVQESNAEMTKMLTGVFSAIQTINIYMAKGLAFAKLDTVLENKRVASVKNWDFRTCVGTINNFIGYVAQYGVILGAYVMVYFGRLTIGQAVSIQMLMPFLASPLFSIIPNKNAMDGTKEIREKIIAILEEPEDDKVKAMGDKEIVFNNVAFSYTEDSFIENLALEFLPGKKYLITGESGSGKSTIMKLLLKEIAPVNGSIMYGTEDIASYNSPTWYNNISYLGQKIEIMPGTLQENIVMGSKYNKGKFNSIIQALNLEYLLSKTNENLDSELVTFSGGEIQRIALARALYKDSPMIFLDEFSSALDTTNAFNIEKTLLETADKTIISISHRLHENLLGYYDKIIVMKEGKVEKVGTAADMAGYLQQPGPIDC